MARDIEGRVMVQGTVSAETRLYRRILAKAEELGGGQEGIKVGCHPMYGYWLASVAIDAPRKRGRFVSGQGGNVTQALLELEGVVWAAARERGLL